VMVLGNVGWPGCKKESHVESPLRNNNKGEGGERRSEKRRGRKVAKAQVLSIKGEAAHQQKNPKRTSKILEGGVGLPEEKYVITW